MKTMVIILTIFLLSFAGYLGIVEKKTGIAGFIVIYVLFAYSPFLFNLNTDKNEK